MSETERIRLGLVGAGAIAQLAHLPALSKLRGGQLVALCDNDGPKAGALAERFEVPHVFTDLEDMLESDELDAVIIATPNHLHEPHVLSAIRSEVDVLCERPLAMDSRGVERILDAAQRTGRKVVVGNNHRFRNDVQQLSRFLYGGELGRVTGMRAGEYQFRTSRDGWRYRRAEAGGGAFFEHGVPLLDLALWLAGSPDPVRLTAYSEKTPAGGGVEDAMFVHLECAAKVDFTFDINWAYIGQEERWWFEVLGSRGSARLAPLRVVKDLNGKPTDVSPTGASARESVFLQSYRAELAHFVALLTGAAEYEPPTDQLKLHRIIEAIYRSAAEGAEIRF